MMYATVGKTRYPATSFGQVSRAYRSTIDRLGLGASQTPPCRIEDKTGRPLAYVSYNGKVWKGGKVGEGNLLYDPATDD